MTKRTILTISLYAILTIVTVISVVVRSFGIDLTEFLSDWVRLVRFSFAILSLTASLALLLMSGWYLWEEYSKRQLNHTINQILDNKVVTHQPDTDLGNNILRLSTKMQHLTANLQRTENAHIENTEDIVKQERRRIARDLHDTVSQELFAASLMLSGVNQMAEQLPKEKLKEQLTAIETVLTDAQKDLRILLLHLRPTELDGRNLAEGLEMILQELQDKSDIQVSLCSNMSQLPRSIEENLFRIAQEFISNTLKHAQATRLEVYLNQQDNEVQLKMIDDGKGFNLDAVRSLSYGLKNIEDRVNDLAGSVRFLSQIGQGVSMDIRLPLTAIDKEERDGETDDSR
ncbi:sensor histidine kinase [Streptococcus caprae]|uniref:Sensor histidine kinase n=1 Tax=Streptococcus caprae TaxID=1640501 RepID=A0ABV8CW59_9STRE